MQKILLGNLIAFIYGLAPFVVIKSFNKTYIFFINVHSLYNYK